jgi:Dihydrofolate reductase
MGKLSSFNFISLNGFYKGPDEDTSWHSHGEEEIRFSEEMLALNNILLFGRKTYEMMADFWTTDMAFEMLPKVAEGMNRAEKIVFSTQIAPDDIWQNTRFVNQDLYDAIHQLKLKEAKNMTILGSGTLVRQLASRNLIDEYQFMIDPVILGQGASLFEGLQHSLNLKLAETRTFSDGVVLLIYKKH